MVQETFQIPLTSQARMSAAGSAVCFVGGEENQLVSWLADAPVEKLQENRLTTMLGPSGVGKTSLVNELAHCWQQQNPADEVMVIHAADYARNYANAVELDDLTEFRKSFDSHALIVIESLEQLESKSAAQLELISLLDRSQEGERAFLFTAKSTDSLDEVLLPRLHSRLFAGLTIPVCHPHKEARYQIVKELAAGLLELSDEVIDLLADRLKTANDLNHAIRQIQFVAKHEHTEIDRSSVEKLLDQWETERSPTISRVCRLVCKELGVKLSMLRGPSRQRLVVRARGLAVVLTRQVTTASLAELGQYLGGRDHTTILHAEKKTRKELEQDTPLKNTFDKLREQLGAPS